MKTGSEKESKQTRRRDAKICYGLGIVLISFGTIAYLYNNLYLPILGLPSRQYFFLILDFFLFLALFGIGLLVVGWTGSSYKKETVLIHCSYCSQLMPVASAVCPHCNAMRTD
jgi:hypothetical protein